MEPFRRSLFTNTCTEEIYILRYLFIYFLLNNLKINLYYDILASHCVCIQDKSHTILFISGEKKTIFPTQETVLIPTVREQLQYNYETAFMLYLRLWIYSILYFLQSSEVKVHVRSKYEFEILCQYKH